MSSPLSPETTPRRQSPALVSYWRANLRLMALLLVLWAVAGLGAGVLFADRLNELGSIGGFPLGFWFAQQGSIIVFILLILVYAISMNRLDAQHHRDLERESGEPPR
jgi:putative solute:sodium symporter small subunit